MIEKIGMHAVPAAGITKASSAVGGLAGTLGGLGANAGPNFASFLRGFADKSVDATSKGELASVKAVDKDAELVDVVTAVSNAEVTLDTVVTLRDKVIGAYQEIIRMPI